MSNVIGELIYKFSGDMSALTSAIKSSETAVKGMGDKVNQSFASQTASIFKGVAGWDILRQSVQEASEIIKESIVGGLEDMRNMAQTKSILESLGQSWDSVGVKMDAMGTKFIDYGIGASDAELQTARFAQRLGGDLTKAMDLATLSADLSTSGFGTFEEVSSDLEKVISGKGTKAMIKYGVVIDDTATITEQLSAIQQKATIKASDYADTIDGKFKKMKTASDELKSALGQGLVIAFDDVLRRTGILSSDLGTNEESLKQLSKFAFQLANSMFLISSPIMMVVKGLALLQKTAVSLTTFGLEKMFTGIELVAKGLNAMGVKNQGTIDTFDKLRKDMSLYADQVGGEVVDKTQEGIDAFDSLGGTVENIFLDGFEKATAKATEALKKVQDATGGVSKETKDAGDEVDKLKETQKTAFEDMQKSVLDAKNKVTDLANEISSKLTQAFIDFKDSMKDTISEGTKGLADIVIGAEQKIKEAKDEIAKEQKKDTDKQNADTIQSLQDSILEQQKILEASAKFKEDLAKKLTDRQKIIDELTAKVATETDPTKKAILETEIEARQTALDQLKGLGSLEAEITEARRVSNLDEFTAYKEELYAKIDLTTTAFITETTQLREKLELSKSVESEITTYLKSQTELRQADLDAFAISVSATLSKIGTDAKSAMDSLNSLQSLQSRITGATGGASTGTGKALGGYTVGGEYVHPNEYVIPSWIVNAMPSLVSGIEKMRVGGGIVNNKSVSAPITVNANVEGGVDAGAIGRELAWELERL